MREGGEKGDGGKQDYREARDQDSMFGRVGALLGLGLALAWWDRLLGVWCVGAGAATMGWSPSLLVKTGFPIGSEEDGEAISDPETGVRMGLERESWLLGTPLEARNRSGRDWNAGRRKRGKSRNGRPSNRRLQDNGNKAAWR